MNELTNIGLRKHLRSQLLCTVAALAFAAHIQGSDIAAASDRDADRPTVWIELGGQMDHLEGQGDSFPVGFLAENPTSPVLQPTNPLQAQSTVPFTFGAEGRVTFQPAGSDWSFSAAVRYGRSSNFRHVDHQTNEIHYKYKSGVKTGQPRTTEDFADTQARHQDSYAILDFMVGKDVGMGLFGRDGSSTFSLGVRFAQFNSKATFDVRARPDIYWKTGRIGKYTIPLHSFHTYHNTGQASRNFHGVGPSLAWSGTLPVMGNVEDGQLGLNWGANVAVLFGKQRANVEHHEAAKQYQPASYTSFYQRSGGHANVRTVTIPNVGGFAGATYRIEDFKLSLGYRADFFFGAMDGGIDARKSETLGFHGPFATICLGLGG